METTAPTELVMLAKQAAAGYQIYPQLVCGIVERESDWRPWTIRWEPGFFSRYVAPQKITDPTEAMGRAFSWGLMQVMGETAREQGYEGPLAELCDPDIGLRVGCRVLAAKLAAAEGNVATALRLWNGGGNPNYAQEVLALAEHYA